MGLNSVSVFMVLGIIRVSAVLMGLGEFKGFLRDLRVLKVFGILRVLEVLMGLNVSLTFWGP